MKLLLLAAILASCTSAKATIKLELGTCYYEGGDFGGTPSIIHCVQAVGEDGFLRCQGSESIMTDEFRWYDCRDNKRWSWLDKPVVVDCPVACPTLRNP